MKFTIKEIKIDQIEIVKNYILKSRQELYPMLDSDMASGDLPDFEALYISNNESCIFIATDKDNSLIGCIGLKPLDNRFSDLNYAEYKTAEMVKLYVSKEYRNNGIATALVNKTINKAIEIGYQVIYLHTHPFLTGAVNFWRKNGFILIHENISAGLITIHMELHI